MVNVELTEVDWLKSAVFTVVLLVDCVWVLVLVVGFLVYSLTLIPSSKGGRLGVSKFDFSRTTD